MNRTCVAALLMFPLALACSSTGPGSGVNGSGANGSGANGSGANGSGASANGTGSGAAPGSAGSTLVVGTGGTGGSGGADSLPNGECARQDFDLARKPAEILLVLDRSGSMKDPPNGSEDKTPKWDLVVPGVNEVVTAADASVSWGLKAFPEGEGKACIVGSVTDAIPVAIAVRNAVAVTGAIAAMGPNGNGTPTGDAIDAAVKYLKTLTDENPKFILLATDGEPSCASTTESGDEARPYAVKAVKAAFDAGYKTFVVGVATTKKSASDALNDMAEAGGMARPDATKYYLANTKDELVASLKTITGAVSSCVFDLKSAPPEPDNVAVHVDTASVPRDKTKTNGWDYSDASSLRVEVFGTWCEQIKAADSNSVNFVLGCPGEVVF